MPQHPGGRGWRCSGSSLRSEAKHWLCESPWDRHTDGRCAARLGTAGRWAGAVAPLGLPKSHFHQAKDTSHIDAVPLKVGRMKNHFRRAMSWRWSSKLASYKGNFQLSNAASLSVVSAACFMALLAQKCTLLTYKTTHLKLQRLVNQQKINGQLCFIIYSSFSAIYHVKTSNFPWF